MLEGKRKTGAHRKVSPRRKATKTVQPGRIRAQGRRRKHPENHLCGVDRLRSSKNRPGLGISYVLIDKHEKTAFKMCTRIVLGD